VEYIHTYIQPYMPGSSGLEAKTERGGKVITIHTNKCTQFYYSHNITTHQVLHVSGLTDPSSESTQFYKTVILHNLSLISLNW